MRAWSKFYVLAAVSASLGAQDGFRGGEERETAATRLAREQWFYSQRAYPLGRIPTGARIQAVKALRALERSRQVWPRLQTFGGHGVTNDATNWISIGPQPTDHGSPFVAAGRVNSIAIDPRDNNTLYIAAAEGGVWKTTDGGSTWTPLTDQENSLASGAIAIDPSNPDTVYVGTGEDNNASDSYYGAGILKSTNAGQNWASIVGPFLRDRIAAIAVHPSDGKTLLGASYTGLWRSTDGAMNWTRVLGPASGSASASDVVFDPTNGNIAYAGLQSTGSGSGVYKSTDAGATWVQLTGTGANALPSANVGRLSIGIAPSNPSTLYVQIENTSSSKSGQLLGIWKTTDAGGTWNQLSGVPTASAGNFLWYSNVVRVNPKDPNMVIGGGLRLYRTLDGGNTWSALPQQGAGGAFLHVDQHAVAFTPDGAKLYIANDGGMYSTASPNGGGVTWTELNDTLAITQFYPGMSLDPGDPQFALIGTQDNGTQQYSGSQNWSTFDCGDGAAAAADRLSSHILYAACAPGSIGVGGTIFNAIIFKSIDGGQSDFFAQYGIDQGDRLQFIPPLVMDFADPRVLYFGTTRIWQTLDGGGRWKVLSADLTGGAYTVKSIAISGSDPNVVYAATGTTNAATDLVTPRPGLVWVTTRALDPAGAAWTQAAATGLPRKSVTRIAVDPLDPATVYAVVSGFGTGHVFRSKDSGATFADISSNLPDMPVNDVVIDPDVPDTLYIATDAGVMISSNAGGSWAPLGSGLPKVVVHGLSLHRNARILRAATHGRGAWDIAVPLVSPSVRPLIASLSPATANAGSGALSLVVNGSNFVSGDVVRWNGQALPTTFVSGTQLRAQVPAPDLGRTGRTTITVFAASSGGGASNQAAFDVGPAPAATPLGVVSAANPTGGNSLGAGAIASLYGTNLGGNTALADLAPPLPSTLGETTVTISGEIVPLFFVSPGQINFQVPNLPVGGPTQVQLTITHGDLSTKVPVTVVPYAPALFTTNAQGSGQGSVLIAGTSSLAARVGAFEGARPVKKGEFVSIYCTGLGSVTRTPALGFAAPSNPPATTRATPTVSIGGVNATVSFSGLAPGFVGLYQVNAQVPDTAPSGDSVNVALSIGGSTSNTVTIAIQ